MKQSTFLVTALMVTFGFSAISYAAGEGMKYGTVDIAKIFDEYQKTKDNDQNLQRAAKKKEEERDAIVHEVRQIKDELVLLTADAKAKKQEALEMKLKELQEFDQGAKRELGNQRNTVVREIFKEIDDTIQRYGQRKGLDLVFNERALLFHNAQFDATAEILAEINKEYAKKKK